MTQRQWKIGELAAGTGLTVRALHYFDEIGLLRPSGRSAAGHRLYGEDDVRHLYRILALRELGMPLREIARVLDGSVHGLAETIDRQLQQANERIARYRQLRRRLLALKQAAQHSSQPSAAQLIDVMEVMMQASYFTPGQLAQLKERHQKTGTGEFARWQERWTQLAAEISAHIDHGTDPADPAAQQTACRWSNLMQDMSGGDPGIVSAMYAKLDGKGPEAATRGIVSTEAWDYIKRALAVGYSFPG
jgi:DNA-binding transcriptional MerR regulator